MSEAVGKGGEDILQEFIGCTSNLPEYDIFICAIWWDSLDALWRWRTRTVKNILIVFKRTHTVGDEVFEMVEGMANLGPFPFIYEVVMGVAFYTLVMSMRKFRYTGHIQWRIVRKVPTAWSNLYEEGECGSLRVNFSKDEIKLVSINFPTRGPWFVKLMGG